MTSGTGSGLVSRNKEGTQIVLAQFPPSGSTLSAFGLTPSIIKTIAIPNDIQDWPSTALNGCTNLEKISVYGEESQTGEISLTLGHNLSSFSKLTSVQLPSTITEFTTEGGTSAWNEKDSSTLFPKCLVSITLPKRLKSIANNVRTFLDNQVLQSIDFSRCSCLASTGTDTFFYCGKITSMDFSNCPALTLISWCSFAESSLNVVIIPPSVTSIDSGAFTRSSFKILIWKGRSSRPETGISSRAFSDTQTLDQLTASGTIQEIFVP